MSDSTTKPAAAELLGADDAEAILAMDDLATTEVYVPEWKRTVRIRQVTAFESLQLAGAKEGMLAIVAMSVVDAQGQRIFKDPDKLRGKSAGALSRIQDAALRLNGFVSTPEAAKAAAAALKNG